MIIFRKKTNEEILASKVENEEGKKGDSKGKKNSFLEWLEETTISFVFVVLEEVLLEFYVLFDAAVDAVIVPHHLVL
jgi:hypothetical protein